MSVGQDDSTRPVYYETRCIAARGWLCVKGPGLCDPVGSTYSSRHATWLYAQQSTYAFKLLEGCRGLGNTATRTNIVLQELQAPVQDI